MAAHRITHVRKPNRQSPHDHITHVAYDGYIHTRESVIAKIEAQTDTFYVSERGNYSDVGVVYPDRPRLPYLRTYADNTWNDNLLSLPEC